MNLKQYFAQLKVDLEPMTFPEKIDHIWTYNKELILIVVGFGILIIGLLVAFLQKPDVVFCGFVINGELSEAGTNYLTTDYGNRLGVFGKQEVQLISGIYNLELSSAAAYNDATMQQINAYCYDSSLDYILADKVALEAWVGADIYLDLREILGDEAYEQWKDKFLTCKLEDGTEIAYAVNISDTKFAKDCVTNKKEMYISFINNTQHLDRCKDFWNYILAWN